MFELELSRKGSEGVWRIEHLREWGRACPSGLPGAVPRPE